MKNITWIVLISILITSGVIYYALFNKQEGVLSDRDYIEINENDILSKDSLIFEGNNRKASNDSKTKRIDLSIVKKGLKKQSGYDDEKIIISKEGRFLAVQGGKTTDIYFVDDLKPRHIWRLAANTFRGFDPSEKYILVQKEHYEIIEIGSWKTVAKIPILRHWRFSSKGKYFVAFFKVKHQDLWKLMIYQTVTGKLCKTIEETNDIRFDDFKFSPQEDYFTYYQTRMDFFCTEEHQKLKVFSMDNWDEILSLPVKGYKESEVIFFSSNIFYVSNASRKGEFKDRGLLYDLARNEIIGKFSGSPYGIRFDDSPDGIRFEGAVLHFGKNAVYDLSRIKFYLFENKLRRHGFRKLSEQLAIEALAIESEYHNKMDELDKEFNQMVSVCYGEIDSKIDHAFGFDCSKKKKQLDELKEKIDWKVWRISDIRDRRDHCHNEKADEEISELKTIYQNRVKEFKKTNCQEILSNIANLQHKQKKEFETTSEWERRIANLEKRINKIEKSYIKKRQEIRNSAFKSREELFIQVVSRLKNILRTQRSDAGLKLSMGKYVTDFGYFPVSITGANIPSSNGFLFVERDKAHQLTEARGKLEIAGDIIHTQLGRAKPKNIVVRNPLTRETYNLSNFDR
jgi:hypothetical protein